MCLLSIWWKDSDNYVLTHSRDEDARRSFDPNFTLYEVHEKKVWYPKDEMGGGTWIYYSEQYIAVVLNGGFKFHMPGRGGYRMSRGQLVLELLKYPSIDDFVGDLDLENIEPFTFVMIDRMQGQRKRLVWDGVKKHLKDLNDEVFIWSSATLYSEEQMQSFRFDFTNFFESGPKTEDIMEHHYEHRLLKHPFAEFVRTVAISQIRVKNGQLVSLLDSI